MQRVININTRCLFYAWKRDHPLEDYQVLLIAAITSLSHNDRAELRKKFDIVFLLAQEKLSYPSICELEERHGVQVGSAYRTEKAAKSFSHYIAQCQRQQLVETVKFFFTAA